MVFHGDLDNTLIYSYKHNRDVPVKWVETYQGREISFMTEISWHLLQQVRKQVLFVPTTTRTVEQYQRIRLGSDTPEYALVCNGGLLLVNGGKDEDWYEESRALTAECQKELHQAERILETDEYVDFQIRNIEDLFVFTKSAQPKETVRRLRPHLDVERVDVWAHGAKIYIIPKTLSKGEAVKRFRHRVPGEQVVAAGDSRFDISMLEEADLALAEHGLKREKIRQDRIIYLGTDRYFSDCVLEYVNFLTGLRS